uniref:Pepsin inhibitor-3-like repeated domain-containing protein n=2 Tax=Wuchereria bancrofti TaxID=6293 RepID=A0AAF5PLG1_WUCBA
MLFYLLLLVTLVKSQVQHTIINSFNNNVICVNNVCYDANGLFVSGSNGCYVINGKIYKNGLYLRDMTVMDYRKLEIYNQEVNRWSVNLQDSIQRSFPWDVRNPSHTEFPWNMMSREKRRINDQNRRHRHKRFMPFPVVPYFC